MLRILACIELFIALVSLALVFFSWPGFSLCKGRPLGFDCESWFIFAVNIFGPLGLLALVCSGWSIRKRSWVPQYFMVAGCVILIIYLFSHG